MRRKRRKRRQEDKIPVLKEFSEAAGERWLLRCHGGGVSERTHLYQGAVGTVHGWVPGITRGLEALQRRGHGAEL